MFSGSQSVPVKLCESDFAAFTALSLLSSHYPLSFPLVLFLLPTCHHLLPLFYFLLYPLLFFLFSPSSIFHCLISFFPVFAFIFFLFNDLSELCELSLLSHLSSLLFSRLCSSFIPNTTDSENTDCPPFDPRFPFSLLPPSLRLCPQDVQIVSTDENQVFLALQEWYQSDTYNLYQSDPQGVYYSIILENVRSTKQPEENVLIDILEVRWGGGVGTSLMALDKGPSEYLDVSVSYPVCDTRPQTHWFLLQM